MSQNTMTIVVAPCFSFKSLKLSGRKKKKLFFFHITKVLDIKITLGVIGSSGKLFYFCQYFKLLFELYDKIL